MELFVTKVNGWEPLSFVKTSLVQDFAVMLDTPLSTLEILIYYYVFFGAEYTDLMGPLL